LPHRSHRFGYLLAIDQIGHQFMLSIARIVWRNIFFVTSLGRSSLDSMLDILVFLFKNVKTSTKLTKLAFDQIGASVYVKHYKNFVTEYLFLTLLGRSSWTVCSILWFSYLKYQNVDKIDQIRNQFVLSIARILCRNMFSLKSFGRYSWTECWILWFSYLKTSKRK